MIRLADYIPPQLFVPGRVNVLQDGIGLLIEDDGRSGGEVPKVLGEFSDRGTEHKWERHS